LNYTRLYRILIGMVETDGSAPESAGLDL